MTPRDPSRESALQAAVVEGLTWLGCMVEHVQPGKRGGPTKGAPDLWVLLPGGGVVLIELKRADGTGRVSPEQKAWHARAAECGHPVHVVNDKDEALAIVRAAMEAR
jgi:hypothetical protein